MGFVPVHLSLRNECLDKNVWSRAVYLNIVVQSLVRLFIFGAMSVVRGLFWAILFRRF